MFSSNKYCVICESFAKFHCQRCIEPYCSVECQIRDWPNHKFICAPMPKLVSAETLAAPFQKTYLKSISYSADPAVNNSTNKLCEESKHITPLRRPHLDKSTINTSDPNCEESSTKKLDEKTKCVKAENELQKKHILNKNLDNNDKEMYQQQTMLLQKSYSELPKDTFSNMNKMSTDAKSDFAESSEVSNVSKNFNALLISDSSKNHKQFYDDDDILNNSDNSASKAISCNTGQPSADTHATNIDSFINSDSTKEDNRSTYTAITSVTKKLWKTIFPMPEKEFFDVAVQHYDTNAKLAWVTDVELLKKQEKFLQKINSQSRAMQSILKTDDIHFGNLYGVRYSDGVFYRAVCVEEINPLNEVKVRLLDYGNNFIVNNYQELRYSTPLMQNNNAFTFCIRYPNEVEIGKILKICIDFKELDPILGCVYSVKEDIIGLSTNRNEVALPHRSILSILPSNFKIRIINFIDENSESNAFVEIFEEESKIKFQKLDEILKSEQALQFDFSSKPKKGDFVAASVGNMWRRAIILDIFAEKYLIFMADIPEINFVNQIKKLPKEYQELPLNISLIQIQQIFSDHMRFSSQIFKCLSVLDIKNYDANLFKDSINACDLYEQNVKIGKVILKNFDGNFSAIMGNNVWIIRPKNDDIVRITEVVNHYTIHIVVSNVYDYYRASLNSLGPFVEEEFKNKKMENCSNFLEKSVVLVKKNAQEFVRCRIIKVRATNEYEVFDLDSGSVFQTKIDNLLPAPDFVRFMPVVNAKIILNDVNSIRSTNCATTVCLKKLKNFVEDNIEFKLKIISDNVYLNFCDNEKESLNHILVSDLENNFNESIDNAETVKGVEDKCNIASQVLLKKYYIKDIEVIPIPTGKNVQILTLDNSFLNRGFITGCVKDVDFLQKLFGDYQNDIDKFCADQSNGIEYLPEYDEVCLALFDDHWYRAFCLQNKNGKYNVMFVDYGNTVWITKNEIRKFDKKFLHKAIANTCFIEGIPKNPNQDKLKKLSENLFLPNVIFTADEVKAISDYENLITLKDVTKYFE